MDPALLVEIGLPERRLAAGDIQLAAADVIALQEVEYLDTLKRFRNRLLGRTTYPYAVGIDGADLPLIDVIVLSRLPIVHVRSHQHLTDPVLPTAPLFWRACLEVDAATLTCRRPRASACGGALDSLLRRRGDVRASRLHPLVRRARREFAGGTRDRSGRTPSPRYAPIGPRFDGVGVDGASEADHCPIVMEVRR